MHLPIVADFLLLEQLADSFLTGIVGGHGQEPIVVLKIFEVLEVLHCRFGRHFEISTFISDGVALQSVPAPGGGDELPGTGCLRSDLPKIDRTRIRLVLSLANYPEEPALPQT